MTVGRKLVAEGLGTLILVGTVVGSGIMADRLTDDAAMALWANTAATGAILVVLILVFGPVSGAHFNPAVTLAFRLFGSISNRLAFAYVIVQVAAGILGVVLAHAMFGLELIQVSTTSRTGMSVWLSEVVATFALLLAIFGCVRFHPNAVAFAVGLVITAGYWWTASTSFANPAVAVARGLTETFSGIAPRDIPPFVLAQMGAALIFAPLLRWFFQEKP